MRKRRRRIPTLCQKKEGAECCRKSNPGYYLRGDEKRDLLPKKGNQGLPGNHKKRVVGLSWEQKRGNGLFHGKGKNENGHKRNATVDGQTRVQGKKGERLVDYQAPCREKMVRGRGAEKRWLPDWARRERGILSVTEKEKRHRLRKPKSSTNPSLPVTGRGKKGILSKKKKEEWISGRRKVKEGRARYFITTGEKRGKGRELPHTKKGGRTLKKGKRHLVQRKGKRRFPFTHNYALEESDGPKILRNCSHLPPDYRGKRRKERKKSTHPEEERKPHGWRKTLRKEKGQGIPT